MERYIGFLKRMVSLMSNIDADLANKALISEHLNHLPNSKPDEEDESDEDDESGDTPRVLKSTYPRPLFAKGLRIRTPITAHWYKLIRGYFAKDIPQWPFTDVDITLWKKYCLREGCTIGSDSETNCAVNRRDDNCIWYWQITKNQGGRITKRVKKWGQVVVFIEVLNWEAVAIVKPFKEEVPNKRFGTVSVGGGTTSMEVVTIANIGGLIGRIETDFDGKKTFLVGKGDEYKK